MRESLSDSSRSSSAPSSSSSASSPMTRSADDIWCLETIQSSSDMMITLLNDVLDVAKIEVPIDHLPVESTPGPPTSFSPAQVFFTMLVGIGSGRQDVVRNGGV